MTPGEADARDLLRLRRFLIAECKKWGLPHSTDESTKNMQAVMAAGSRYTFLTEGPAVTALLRGHPVKTDRGPAYAIPLFLVAFDHPDKVTALDALILWSVNRLRSEGVRLLYSRSVDPRSNVTIFARDLLGFWIEPSDTSAVVAVLHQWGDTEVAAACILERHPEWRTSLSSMTPT